MDWIFASEMISTARLISHLSQLNKNIFIVDYPNIPVKSIQGDIIFPKALSETATFQVNEIIKHFKLIDKKELSHWVNLWDEKKLGNHHLRILEPNGEIVAKSTDYFDSFLLMNCDDAYQKSAKNTY